MKRPSGVKRTWNIADVRIGQRPRAWSRLATSMSCVLAIDAMASLRRQG